MFQDLLPSRNRPSLALVARGRPEIDAAERTRLSGLADHLLRDEPALKDHTQFGAGVSKGLCDCPALLIGDQREIGLQGRVTSQTYEHRILLLAGQGDLLLVEQDHPGFEAYMCKLLDIDPVETLVLGPPAAAGSAALPARLRKQSKMLSRVARHARAAGGLQILPHIATGAVWALAGALGEAAGVPVKVAAPPPRLGRRVNQKTWFARRLKEVLGRDALPPTFSAYGPAALAAKMRYLARRAARIVVKTPDSAGGEGNVMIEAATIRNLDLDRMREIVLSVLRTRGWDGRYPLLVGIWDADVIASPSVQFWIPDQTEANPVFEGLFEQRLTGTGGEFIGAAPAVLAEQLSAILINEAYRMALLFQMLGYFGRCSFDALLVGPDRDTAKVHWIECNGRWGGVSLPLSLRNRLYDGSGEYPMMVVHDRSVPLRVRGFQENLVRLGSLALTLGGTEGAVLLSPFVYERGQGLHLVVFAQSQDRCDVLTESVIRRLASNGGAQARREGFNSI